MIYIFFGAPGAGKGTQAENFVKEFGYVKLSTGDAFRRNIENGTPLGLKVKDLLSQGLLVPDELTNELLKNELLQLQGKKVILDGYPRNLEQAKTLDSMVSAGSIKKVIVLDVPKEELIKRLSGRRVCRKCSAVFHVFDFPPKKEGVCDKCSGELYIRDDDKPEKISKRLEIYEDQTKPIIAFYEAKGLCRSVNGVGSGHEVFERIKSALNAVA